MTIINLPLAGGANLNCDFEGGIARVRRGEKVRKYIALFVILGGTSVLQNCLDPYTAPAALSHVNYLVVDGFLSDASGPTVIHLSRTTPLTAGEQRVAERNAIVEIQDENGAIYPVSETDSGSYVAQLSAVDPAKLYQLKIRTSNNKEYASDFVPFKVTPVIDTITWDSDGEDVTVYANAHDDNNDTHYYLWNFEETWAYHSAYPSQYKLEDGQIVLRDEDIYHCWKTLSSTQIEISSSLKLSRDVISNYVLEKIPLISERFQDEYSMLLHQFALTKEAYEYWQQLKKNTENIGTIFGPQPSQATSNIHCITNPNESVIGYFSACSNREKRIFIRNNELPPSRHITGYEYCELDTLFIAQVPNYRGIDLLVSTISVGLPPVLIGYSRSDAACVDCRLHGGTTVKPDFWK